MIKYFLILVFSISTLSADMLLIRGADGTADFTEPLDKAIDDWQALAKKANLTYHIAKGGGSKKSFLESLKKSKKESFNPLWIIYIGHGTFINNKAKLNLVGEDLSAIELNKELAEFKREVIFINCASASAPFIQALSKPGRIVITATMNPSQVYYTKFNEFMVKAMTSADADYDKDGQNSLFESFLFASRSVKGFYDQDKRLIGENALIDDNGDKKGTLVDFFDGLKPKKNKPGLDGFRAHQIHIVPGEEERAMSPELRAQRDKLELKLHSLRLRKDKMKESDYFSELEGILKKLSKVYSQK